MSDMNKKAINDDELNNVTGGTAINLDSDMLAVQKGNSNRTATKAIQNGMPNPNDVITLRRDEKSKGGLVSKDVSKFGKRPRFGNTDFV